MKYDNDGPKSLGPLVSKAVDHFNLNGRCHYYFTLCLNNVPCLFEIKRVAELLNLV